MVEIETPYSKDELKTLPSDLVSKADISVINGEMFLYWQITRGVSVPRNLIFPVGEKANLWVTVTPRKLLGVDLGTSDFIFLLFFLKG